VPKSTRRYPISIPNNNVPFANRPFSALGATGGGTPPPASPAPAGPRPAPQTSGGAPYGNRPYQGGGGGGGNNRGRPPSRFFDQTRINERIRAPKVRVVDGTTHEQLGVMATPVAIRLAKDRGVDLVEVAPNADPPVCKVIDYGKYKYALEKHKKEAHKHHKASKLKELKFRVGIDPHDYLIKMVHAEDFLAEGHKVRVQLQFRGRQMAHQELGFELMKRVKADLISMAHVDMEPRQAGRNINMQLSPLPERQRVRKFKTTHRHAELIDKNEDFDADDVHHDDHAKPAPGPAAATKEPAAAEAPAPPADPVKSEGAAA
jgi:translation initiation factor IF-3